MSFAFMNADHTLNHISAQELMVAWNSCIFQNLRTMLPADRHAQLVYDVVPANNTDAPIGQRYGNSTYTIDQVAGTATEVKPLIVMQAPEAAAQLASLQAAKRDAISAHRDDLHLNGGVSVGGKWYATDAIRRSQWLGLMLLGANIPAGVNASAMDNTTAPLTQALATSIFAAIAANDAAQVAAAQAHVTAMLLLADPRQYTAHTLPANWPAAYVPPVLP